MKKCPFCAEEIQDEAIVCKHCGRNLFAPQPTPAVAVQGPSPGVAAVLSFFIPGLGQLYKSQVGAGVVWFLCTAFGYVLFIVPGIILHLCCIVNAASTTQPIAAAAPTLKCAVCGQVSTAGPAKCSNCGHVFYATVTADERAAYAAGTGILEPPGPIGPLSPEEAATAKASNRKAFGALAGGLVVLAAAASLFIYLGNQQEESRRQDRESREAASLAALAAGNRPTPPASQMISEAQPGLFTKGATVSDLLASCGPADTDESSEHERPRPLMVTRILTYRAPKVRLVYVPDAATVQTPPPYRDWKIVRLLDLPSQTQIGAGEAARRMRNRCK